MSASRVRRKVLLVIAGIVLAIVILNVIVFVSFLYTNSTYKDCVRELQIGFSSISVGSTKEDVVSAMKMEPAIISQRVESPHISEVWTFSCKTYGTHFAVNFDNSGLVVNKEEYDFP